MTYAITRLLLSNQAYGFPRGARRRIAPRRLACIHVTGNPSTPPASATQERNYANRDRHFDSADPDTGPSAHWYVDRDGEVVEAIDVAYAAWSNGDLRSPQTTVPGVAEVVALRASGRNANEDYLREYECCGRPSGYPITTAQIATLADRIALDSIETGIPIERATVHLHSDLNTETRRSCPAPFATKELWADALIRRALVRRDELRKEEPMAIRVKAEAWRPTVTNGRSNGVLRAVPDIAAPLVIDDAGAVVRLAADREIVTLGEIDTDTARPEPDATADDLWRVTRWRGATVFLARRDLVPLTPGGDPALDAALDAFIARTPAACTDEVRAATEPLNEAVLALTDKLAGAQSARANLNERRRRAAIDLGATPGADI